MGLFRLYLEELENHIFYHGTPSISLAKTGKFSTPEVYLTKKKNEALGFGLGGHRLGSSVGKAYILSIDAQTGKTLDASEIVERIIMEEDEDFESLEDLMAWAREEGYNYVKFQHPSFFGDDYYEVIVSLHPNKDLTVLNYETAA